MSRGKNNLNKPRTSRDSIPSFRDLKEGMNTKLFYLYRDASNGKLANEIILSGRFRKSELQIIKESLSDGQYFIPHQVGLPDPQDQLDTLDEHVDHPWVELDLEDATEETMAEPTIDLTCQQLVQAFKTVIWDEVEAQIKMETKQRMQQ